MNERQLLIQEIIRREMSITKSINNWDMLLLAESITDFILEDRKRIVGPLIDEMNRETRQEHNEDNYCYVAIKQTITNAGITL